MDKIIEKMSSDIKVINSKGNEYLVKSSARFTNDVPMEVYITVDEKGNRIMTDKKQTIKYMSSIYNMKSNDVANCISSVLKIYNFKMINGAVVADMTDNENPSTKYYNFIMCISQLANMYAFFEEE